MSSLSGAYIYENLKELYRYNPETALCIHEPSGRLYILKQAELDKLPLLELLSRQNASRGAKIIHIEQRNGRLYVLREYISGQCLASKLTGGQCLSADESRSIAINICDSLSPLHKAGLVHRDINPNNIIITDSGRAEIIDFGIMRSFSEQKSTDTEILGTVGYAAPEQFGFSQSDARTDIYSLGVLINVMLTGALPSEKTASGELGAIIRKCTEISSVERYCDIDELKTALINNNSSISKGDKLLSGIPGLRSKNVLINILSVPLYLCALLSAVIVIGISNNPLDYLLMSLSWLFSVLMPFICILNPFDIWQRLPSRTCTKRNQRIIFYTLAAVFFIVGLMIFAIPN